MENAPSSLTLPEPIPSLSSIHRLREGGRERAGFVSLDRNERLSPLPDWVVEAIRAGIDSALLTDYPSLDELYEDLARLLDTPRERLLLTAGSDAAFRALHQAYVRPGDRVVMLDPSYAMYPIYTRMFDGEPVQVPFRDDLTLDPDALLDATTAGVRMVLLANPNQPTGTRLPDEVVRGAPRSCSGGRRAGRRRRGLLPVLAHKLCSPGSSEHPHLVVTRTFSKAWGLAGLRVGAVAAHPEVVANLYKVRSAYDVNAMGATVRADAPVPPRGGRAVRRRSGRRAPDGRRAHPLAGSGTAPWGDQLPAHPVRRGDRPRAARGPPARPRLPGQGAVQRAAAWPTASASRLVRRR